MKYSISSTLTVLVALSSGIQAFTAATIPRDSESEATELLSMAREFKLAEEGTNNLDAYYAYHADNVEEAEPADADVTTPTRSASVQDVDVERREGETADFFWPPRPRRRRIIRPRPRPRPRRRRRRPNWNVKVGGPGKGSFPPFDKKKTT